MIIEYTKYPRGSEWRKWDLHVHTPYSVLNNGFGDDWDIYVTELFKKALEKNISAIGITDYFSVKGYKKIKEEYVGSEEKMLTLFSKSEISRINEILLLPNIEFRLDKLVDDNRINFHIIFSEELSIEEIEEDFLKTLKFVYEGDPQEADKKKSLTERNLTKLGKRLKREHLEFAEQSDIFTGMMNAVVADSEISQILSDNSSAFKGKYLLCIPSDEDLSSVGWDNQAHLTRKTLIQKSDCLFTANAKSIEWGKGLFNNSPSDYIKEFKSLKPCVWGSDAHDYVKLFTPDKNRHLWIKADLTFSGLYHIKHEPHERVKIQELNPNDKLGYRVIDRIERYKKEGDLEPFQTISLNPNLNCIIGGRSTGKSILARSVAYRMNAKDEKLKNESQGYKDLLDDESGKIKVIWQGDKEEGIDHEVEYYGQSFMYELAKESNLKAKNELIKEILEQHGKAQFIDQYVQKEKEISEDIQTLISDLFSQISKLNTTKAGLAQLGAKEGVEKEVLRLKAELTMNGGLSLSEEEREKYADYQNSVQKLRTKIGAFTRDVAAMKLLKSDRVMTHNLDSRVRSLSEIEPVKELQKALVEISSIAQNSWEAKLDGLIKNHEVEIASFMSSILSFEGDALFIRASEVFSRTTLSNSIQQNLKTQESVLAEISQITKEVELTQKNIKELKCAILGKHDEFKIEGAKFSEKIELEENDLKISTSLHSVHDQMKDSWEAIVSQQSSKAKELSTKASSAGLFGRVCINEYFKNALNAILDEDVRMKGSFDQESGLKHLLTLSPYTLNFNIHYEEDSYDEMSDGKKAFVILKLLLEFSKRDCPIILDQPEDDLDNRSIYTDLVKYLKQKKLERQIIVVTHNANIVVGADSELVIVANQKGRKTQNKSNQRFEYLSGSIEHSFPHDDRVQYTLEKQGTREHVCEILEGGNEAFKVRERKYGIK